VAWSCSLPLNWPPLHFKASSATVA
jgi:hypothetical protein